MKPRRIVFAFLGSILALAVTARAQDATLTGTVTDATDAVLPGVTVTALLVETGNTFVAVTDGAGTYRMSAMRPGVYKITAELAGFTTLTRENVQMLVGQATSLALKMALATVSESVTVSGQAPGGGGALRSSGGYFQLLVDGQQVTNLMSTSNFGQPKYARDAIGEFQF